MLSGGAIPPLSEAEIQVLIAHLELAQPKETPNNNFYVFYPRTLDEAATYFRRFREDWTPAYRRLTQRSLLVEVAPDQYHLTEAGVVVAERLRLARPPIYYWYWEYYLAAPSSPAYVRFCAALYGRALCQANFSDMRQMEALLDALRLGPASRVLDLGCGVGLIAEYISDVTGAHVTGLDYAPVAIEQAQARTVAKRDRLAFHVGNLDALPFPPRSFDTLLSIDTLYMPNDLDATLAQMRDLLTPGGQMGIFYTHRLTGRPGESRADLAPDRTPLGQALHRAGLSYRAVDFTAETYVHLQRKRRLAETFRADFAAEGRAFLYDYLVAESEPNPAPFDPATATMSRYLYHVIA